MKKLFMTAWLLLLLFPLGDSVSAATFYDDFDDQASTLSNWSILSPEWTFTNLGETSGQIDYGFRGNYFTDNAKAMVNSEMFDLSNLFIGTNLNAQYREIYEGSNPWPKDEGGAVFFTPEGFTDPYAEGVHASLFYSHYASEWFHSAGYGDADSGSVPNDEVPISGVDFYMDYYLTLEIDESGTLYSTVYNDSGATLSTITLPGIPDLGRGFVGIDSDADTIFNNFTATAVPEPTSLLLLGSGLLGIIGLKRRFKN